MNLGIDIGSTTIKCVLLDYKNEIIYKNYFRHSLKIKEKLLELLIDLKDSLKTEKALKLAISGSAAMGIAKDLDLTFVQEVFATKVCTEIFNKNINTVIELGGEDAKIIFLDSPLEVKMNGTCAGGTGAFIDQMAALLGIPVENFNEEARKYNKIYPIASRCGVFAKTDVQALLNQGAGKSNIAKSIFYSVANQTIVGLAGGRKINDNVLYLGGPLTFFEELRKSFDDTLKTKGLCPENSLYYVAIGTALLAKKEYSLDSLIEKVKSNSFKFQTKALEPLFKDKEEYHLFLSRHKKAKVNTLGDGLKFTDKIFLGIDSGSTTLKLVAINEKEEIVFSRYAQNKGEPLNLLKKFLAELYKENKEVKILASASTGYGEDLIKNVFNLDFSTVETVAHLKAAKKFLNSLEFLVDIGGQDIKCFKIGKEGNIEDIFLNEACSSGCGSFLQSFANTLGYSVEDFSKLALFSKSPVNLGSRCTVFMNSSVKQAQKDGAKIEDIAAGLAISVVKNALYKVIRINKAEDLGKNIVVQGGTFLNDAVLRSFEKELGVNVIRPNISGLMGAYGAALFAKEKSKKIGLKTSKTLKLEELKDFFYKTNSVTCKGCTNNCELTVITFLNGRKYITGNKCEKPTSEKTKIRELPFVTDMYTYKLDLLKEYRKEKLVKEDILSKEKKIIGIPLVLNIYELLPFWYAFFKSLGFKVIVSPISNKNTYGLGQNTIPSDTVCYPAKLVHGHIISLINMGIKNIFYPCMSYNLDEKLGDNHYNCPIVAYYPELIKTNIGSIKKVNFINDYVGLHRKFDFTRKIFKILKKYFPDITLFSIINATQKAYKEYKHYRTKVLEKGKEILSLAKKYKKQIILLCGRPYHIDPEINHNINKLIMSLGAFLLTEDSIAFMKDKKESLEVLNQWTYQSRLYNAAKFSLKEKSINLVQLISFGCGTDSIVSDEVKRILNAEEKIYTGIKIDENSNLGAIKIRLRSLLETIK